MTGVGIDGFCRMTRPAPPVDLGPRDVRVGDMAELVGIITAEHIAAFAALSGDENPLHTDDAWARSAGYRERVAHGQLVVAPVSALAGHLLPGKRCLMLEVRSRFVRPVYAGQRITYRGEVIHVSPAVGALKIRVEAVNESGQIVLRGSYQCRVLATP